MRSLVLLALLGCTEPTDPIEPQVTSSVAQLRIPMFVNRELDVLIVVDNTPAMAPYRDTLRANLRAWAEPLRTTELHLGVVTADPADAAAWRGAVITDSIGPAGERVRNYDGDLADVIAQLGDVGVHGSAASPLAMARRVFERPEDGFFRPTAFTAIFMITANDAPDAVEPYAQFFHALHTDPSKIFVAGVLGAGEQMPAFLDLFPHRNARARLDEADWTAVTAVIPQLHKEPLGAACLEGTLLDGDPITPGTQHVCSAWYDFPVGGVVLPPCDAEDRECWRLVENLVKCPGLIHLELPHKRIDLPRDTMFNLECLTTIQPR